MRPATAVIFLLCVLAMPFAASSQSSRFSFGPSVSVDTYRNPAGYSEWFYASNSTKYSAGLGVYYRAGNRVVLKSGLLYSNKGYTKRRHSNIAAFYSPEILIAEQVKYQRHYLDMPFLLGVKVFERNKFSIVPAIGVVTSVELASFREAKFESGATVKSSLHSRHIPGLSGTVELGLNYQFSEQLQLGLSPYYRLSLGFRTFDVPSSFGSTIDLRFSL